MFLKKYGASGRFQFDEIYSCLQKAMRRCELELSLEMVKEFRDYPNALKKRVVYCCCEDCPNLYLIRDIYNTKPEIDKLIQFVPIICNHVKCREVILSFRAACQERKLKSLINVEDDDVITMCRKVFTRLCENGNDVNEVLKWFIDNIEEFGDKSWKIIQISNFINKCRTVIFTLIAFLKIEYVSVEDYRGFDKRVMMSKKMVEDVLSFKFNDKFDVLPIWVYDKHVHNAPANQKSYEFFINNIVLIPRMPKTEWERRGEELYIETNKASGEYITNDEKKLKKSVMMTTDEVEQSMKPMMTTNDEKKPKKSMMTTTTPTNDNEQPITPTNEIMTTTNQVRISSTDNVPDVLNHEDVELIQVQCITARYKPRTYFMKLKGSGVRYDYILKGPFRTQHEIDEILLSDKLKTLFDLNSPNSKQITFNGDGMFIVGSNWIDVNDPVETITRTTKLETNVTVYNGDISVYDSKRKLSSYSVNVQLELLKILFFRKMIGTNDTCARNIIVSELGVCSIDDPALFSYQTAFMWKVPVSNQTLKNDFKKCLKNNWNEVKTYIEDCKELLMTTSGEVEDTTPMVEMCDELLNINNWHW